MGASGETGFARFARQVREWWPILVAVMGALVMGVMSLARASNSIDEHEVRIDKLEISQRLDALRLERIDAQTGSTAKTVDRLEGKVDRMLMEKSQ